MSSPGNRVIDAMLLHGPRALREERVIETAREIFVRAQAELVARTEDAEERVTHALAAAKLFENLAKRVRE